METSLAVPTSNTGGDVSDLGLPSSVEPPHLVVLLPEPDPPMTQRRNGQSPWHL